MRVIGGTYRSRPLQAPRGTATRPTSDRLRETLFNVLAPRVQGARFADLYAGSGAVGIEAISRGAAAVYFAETARGALDAIRANLRTLGISGGHSVEGAGTAALLKRMAATGAEIRLDLVFLDPPYEEAVEYTRTLGTLGEGACLCDDAVVVAEHARKANLQECYGRLQRTRTLLQGDAALSFYRLGDAGKSAQERSAGESTR